MKRRQFTDAELRGIVADSDGACDCLHCGLAREVLQLRGRMRTLARMCDEHRKKKQRTYVTCGWFGEAEAIVHAALGVKKGTQK